MAYYEDSISGTTDATGAATIQIGPLSDPELHFLGYVVLVVGAPGAASSTVIVSTRSGFPIASAAGLAPSVGPIFIKAGDYKVLQISAAPINAEIVGNLIGGASTTIDCLLVRPRPTQAGGRPH